MLEISATLFCYFKQASSSTVFQHYAPRCLILTIHGDFWWIVAWTICVCDLIRRTNPFFAPGRFLCLFQLPLCFREWVISMRGRGWRRNKKYRLLSSIMDFLPSLICHERGYMYHDFLLKYQHLSNCLNKQSTHGHPDNCILKSFPDLLIL